MRSSRSPTTSATHPPSVAPPTSTRASSTASTAASPSVACSSGCRRTPRTGRRFRGRSRRPFSTSSIGVNPPPSSGLGRARRRADGMHGNRSYVNSRPKAARSALRTAAAFKRRRRSARRSRGKAHRQNDHEPTRLGPRARNHPSAVESSLHVARSERPVGEEGNGIQRPADSDDQVGPFRARSAELGNHAPDARSRPRSRSTPSATTRARCAPRASRVRRTASQASLLGASSTTRSSNHARRAGAAPDFTPNRGFTGYSAVRIYD